MRLPPIASRLSYNLVARAPGGVVGRARTAHRVAPLLEACYAALGTPQAIEETAAAQAPHALTRGQVEVMVQSLIERLKRQPDDAEGWFMLARSHLAFGRYAEAAQAYERVAQLVPGNPELLSDHADALAQANGGRLDGRPRALDKQPLALGTAPRDGLERL